MRFSIVVPCFNEEKNIEALTERFKVLSHDFDFELILVDNGSRDNTQAEIDKACVNNPFVKRVVVPENRGYGFGILAGLEAAMGDNLGWIHADLQSDPLVFADMFEESLTENSDYLYKGARTNRNIFDSLFTKGMALLESIIFFEKMTDVNSQPTLISRSFFERWRNPPCDFSLDLFVYVLALKKEIVIKRFVSPQNKRNNGQSTWNTSWYSRIKMIKSVIDYSFAVKRRMKEVD